MILTLPKVSVHHGMKKYVNEICFLMDENKFQTKMILVFEVIVLLLHTFFIALFFHFKSTVVIVVYRHMIIARPLLHFFINLFVYQTDKESVFMSVFNLKEIA